jgi:hypothetical protein
MITSASIRMLAVGGDDSLINSAAVPGSDFCDATKCWVQSLIEMVLGDVGGQGGEEIGRKRTKVR